MSDILRETDRSERRSGLAAILSWLALALAVVAIILAWIAYNRTGEDLEAQIQNSVNSAVDTSRDAVEQAPEAVDSVERGIDTGPDGVDDGAR